VQRYAIIQELQYAIKSYEYTLLRVPDNNDINRRLKALESKSTGNYARTKFKSKANAINRSSSKPKGKPGFRRKRFDRKDRFRKPQWKPKASAIGYHPKIEYKYSKDDPVVSQHGGKGLL
jgi:hypothetical protein